MRCYYCGIIIIPPDGYGSKTAGVARGQGREVSFRAGRVEYVLVLCPVCYHALLATGWSPPEYHLARIAWAPLHPTAPAQRHIHPGDLSPTLHPETRFAQSGPFDELATDRHVRTHAIGDVLYRQVSSRRRSWLWVAVLSLCVVICACAVVGLV